MKSELTELAQLLAAHAVGDEQTFQRVVKSIIQDLTVRNRHSEARYLQHALDRSQPASTPANTLQYLPRNKRDGEALITFMSRAVTSDHVFLNTETRIAIDRVVFEQRRKRLLEKHNLQPKSKLLFWGPPGCGKTLTAQLIGNELNIPVGVVRLSAVVTSYVGETAANLQRVFTLASQTPMVLFLDEADTLAKKRDDRNDVGELKRVVNSLLQAIDLFDASKSLLIAASNHQYLLDEAVWRRFDDVVEFPLPSQLARTEYICYLLSGVAFNGQHSQLSKKFVDLSFSDIQAVCTEAMKTMVLEERESVTMADLSSTLKLYKEKRKRARARTR